MIFVQSATGTFVGSGNGTVFGVIQSSFSGNFIDFQTTGAAGSVFSINASGYPNIGLNTASLPGEVVLQSGNTTGQTTLEASQGTTNTLFNLPSSNGVTGQYLKTDGSGNTSWSTVSTGTTTNALTLNNSGAGAVSGSTFNGSSAVTLSYNTLGAAPAASPTFTGSVTTPLTTAGLVTTTSGGVLGSIAEGTGVQTALGNATNSAGGFVTSPVPIANGGTNATSATAGSILNATSTTAASWTAIPTFGGVGVGTGGFILAGNTSGTVTCGTSATGSSFGCSSAVQAQDTSGFAWSQTGTATGTTGAELVVSGTGTTEAIKLASNGTNIAAFQSAECKNGSSVTLTSQTTICSFNLENSADAHGYQCQGSYTTTTSSISMTLGVIFSNAPTASLHNAIIYTTNTGTSTSAGAVADTGTAATTVLAGGSVSSATTGMPWFASGSFTGNATAGTFILYGTASTSSDVTVTGTCYLY